MNDNIVLKAAAQFGHGIPVVEKLGNGLINRTYKILFTDDADPLVLQCLNQRVFSRPENVILNYRLIYNHLQQQSDVHIPALVPSHHHKDYWIDADDNIWKATAYIQDSYTHSVATSSRDAGAAASCFAAFVDALTGLDEHQLYIPLPNFHDLLLRYRQFEEAIEGGSIMRLLRATHVIAELRQRKRLVGYYQHICNNGDYPVRLMHHDGKISNILFHRTTSEAICPVDLDTVMPGHFFSDIGDLIRTMSCTVDENSTAWEKIDIQPAYYQAIVQSYLSRTGELFTEQEKKDIHYSGLLMTYMQSLRFVTDFLNNDIYYQTNFPEQNLHRALNQLILLEKLEEYLRDEVGFVV
ncbi:MAG: phosphotransferase [Williamsia sp.]|nr:phosphotransferase [Williamsia sp.]